MKKQFVLSPPDIEERLRHWCHFSEWDVFGDWMEGMPNWNMEALSDGTISASDGRGTVIKIGTWVHDPETDTLTLDIEHEYPTIGI